MVIKDYYRFQKSKIIPKNQVNNQLNNEENNNVLYNPDLLSDESENLLYPKDPNLEEKIEIIEKVKHLLVNGKINLTKKEETVFKYCIEYGYSMGIMSELMRVSKTRIKAIIKQIRTKIQKKYNKRRISICQK